MITNHDRASIRTIFEKIRRDIAPVLEKRAKELGVTVDKQMFDVMVAQNTIRCCMEVVFNQCIPYDKFFCAELAARLAAYSISAAPIEDHSEMVARVQKALPNALATKLREGAIIKTTWMTDGVVHPNVPDRGSVQ